MIEYYPAVFERASDGYGVFFPDLPGCTSAGDTFDEAAPNAEEGLRGHIDLTFEHGEPIPDPSKLDDVVVVDDVDEAARMLIRAEFFEEKPVKLDVEVSGDLLAAANRYATQAGFTRAGLVSQALRDVLREHRYGPVALDA